LALVPEKTIEQLIKYERDLLSVCVEYGKNACIMRTQLKIEKRTEEMGRN